MLSKKHKDRISMSSETRIFQSGYLGEKLFVVVVRALVSIPSWVWHFTKGREEEGKSIAMRLHAELSKEKAQGETKKSSSWEIEATRKHNKERDGQGE